MIKKYKFFILSLLLLTTSCAYLQEKLENHEIDKVIEAISDCRDGRGAFNRSYKLSPHIRIRIVCVRDENEPGPNFTVVTRRF